jgi:lipopolysaccharide/colanic/teichoic acid biosynthesis glycosyltransferase
MLRRIFDILFSILGIILLFPGWIMISIFIKADSRGPVLFRQYRTGKNGCIFTIYKFRTMYSYSERYSLKPGSSRDPRITRVGRVLRDRGWDELPQLINVFKGEMSLIGPRPEMPFITRRYSNIQKRRLELKPGITGLWQILAPSRQPIHENLKYDLYYVRHHGLLLDCWIIIQTIRVIFGMKVPAKYEKNKNSAHLRSHHRRYQDASQAISKTFE